MIWRVGKVENIDIGSGFIPSPGFTIQQDGRPPSLTIIFEDLKTAEQCASCRTSLRRLSRGTLGVAGRWVDRRNMKLASITVFGQMR